MNHQELRENWERFAETDPLFAVISWPDKKGNRWNESEFFKNGADEIRTVMAYLDQLPVKVTRGRALDFGCGVGRLTQPLSERFESVVGLDIAPRMIELARHYNRHPRSCEYVLNPGEDLRLFPDASFDFIYSNITLQHMGPHYALAYIREFVRVLRPGGLVLFQIPALYRPQTFHGKTRALLKRMTPGFLDGAWKSFQRAILRRAVVEMNPIPREKVLQVLEKSGAQVVEVVEDPNAGPEWLGYRYCVRKP